MTCGPVSSALVTGWTQPGSLALVPSGVDHTREKCHTLTASGILRLFFGLTCLFYRRWTWIPRRRGVLSGPTLNFCWGPWSRAPPNLQRRSQLPGPWPYPEGLLSVCLDMSWRPQAKTSLCLGQDRPQIESFWWNKVFKEMVSWVLASKMLGHRTHCRERDPEHVIQSRGACFLEHEKSRCGWICNLKWTEGNRGDLEPWELVPSHCGLQEPVAYLLL